MSKFAIGEEKPKNAHFRSKDSRIKWLLLRMEIFGGTYMRLW
jgi:hypothetical protein